jgi:guanylate kinase
MTKQQLYKSLIICGPSGVGKGTIINELLKCYPDKLGLSVSHTTRLPRPGENNGIHYHFVKKEWMEDKIKQTNNDNFFIEYANVHGNLYGTSKNAVEYVQNQGKLCILDVDVQGVIQIKKSNFIGKYIFIAPPSIELLENRLRLRGTETEEQVKLRLKNAKQELEYGYTKGNFDEIIINDELSDAIKKVTDICKSISDKF